ncbi:uncharacterized protein [Periplaneta americana]|uniref:uncharacterized protein n=1 Tax=Periplaneta americana TaxID=6978 RepID=UPI0037E94DF2
MEIENNKRKRGGNWTSEEKSLLFTLIQKRIAIIENKCTSTNTNAKKEQAWKDIYNDFCASFGDGDRSILRLKEQWKRLKTNAKCNVQKQKNYRRTTGGGCPDPETTDVTLNDLDWDIVASLPHEFTKDDAEFDSDSRASYGVCEISLLSPSEGVTAIEDISIPVSSTPISSTCAVNTVSRTLDECGVNMVSRTLDVHAVNPVSRTLDECGVNVTAVVDNRQSNGSQEETIRDHSTCGRRRKDSAPKPLRLSEYETEILLLQKQKHEADMKHAEDIHKAQMKRDDELHELKKTKLLLEIEELRKHN